MDLGMDLAGYFVKRHGVHKLSRAYQFKHLLLKSV